MSAASSPSAASAVRLLGTTRAALARRIVAAVAVALLCWPVVEVAGSTAWSHRSVDAAGLDAVVVLGSSLEAGRATPLLESRIQRAAALVSAARAAGADPWVVASGAVTGTPGPDGTRVSEAQVVAARLVELGVPRDRLLLEDHSHTTAQNLALTFPRLEHVQPGLHRVAIVTSDGHTARVRLLLHRAVAEGRLSSGYDVVLVGAWTPLADVRGAVLRELRLVSGQRADELLVSAANLPRRAAARG